jgi:hypothetical protein
MPTPRASHDMGGGDCWVGLGEGVLSVVGVEGVARIRAGGPVSGSARVGLLVIPSPRLVAA